MEKYLNVPSSAPLTQREAYRVAVERYRVDRETARIDYSGITWKGQHGATLYAEWDKLPKPTR